MQQHALKWGGRRESASTSSRVFQTAGEGKNDDKGSVDTLIYIIVSRLRQWEGVGRGTGGEVESRMWLGPSLDLAKFHLLPP
jgi:hypothetical protein